MRYSAQLLCLLLLISCSGCAHNDPWSRQDTALQLVYTGLLVVDGMQTSEIQHRPDLVEAGPVARRFLGPNPSTSDTWQYMGTLAISSYLISRALPAQWRPYWQTAGIVTQGLTVTSNCFLELSPC